MQHSKVESPTVLPIDSRVPLESVVCTEELNRRPPRAPDYEIENRALVALAQALADSPRTILQGLAQMILEIFQADSAGISLLKEDGKSFYWPAIAGMWQPHIGGGTPRDFGPCGDVLNCDAPMLFTHWERRYPYLLSAMPLAEEGLLVPFYVDGKAVGTIWAIAHDDRRKFDAEDMRQLVSLGSLASSAYQVVASLDALKQRDEALRQSCEQLEQRVVERTSQLGAVNEELRKEILERKRVEEGRERLLARVQAAHEEAEAAQHRFRDLVNSIEGIVWEADALTFEFSFVSKQAERVLGYPVERWLSEPTFWRDHVHPDDRERTVDFCVKATAEKKGHDFEYRMIAADGRIVWLRDWLTVVVEGDRATSLRSVMVDITERKRADEELDRLRQQLESHNAYLKEEVNSVLHFGRIVGRSRALRHVLQQVDEVASTGATVLITGESGTGKELLAKEIHERGPRSQRPFVRVNCSAIPREMFESEFFGHVRGAFTGAVRDRPGRFQIADGGTIFLDEIGDLPADLQPKLLRVLQEGEYERVGEDVTRKIDVRVIAATNQNLAEEVRARRFRQDLFYRLNVFPLELPPLRARTGDILLLATHAITEVSKRLKMRAPPLTQADAARLQQYDWPGNVRELQNVIERAVILSKGVRLRLDVALADMPATAPTTSAADSDLDSDMREIIVTDREWRERERANLINALKRTDGRIYGEGGAAELLGVNPTTLASRLRALKVTIPKPR